LDLESCLWLGDGTQLVEGCRAEGQTTLWPSRPTHRSPLDQREHDPLEVPSLYLAANELPRLSRSAMTAD